MRPDRTASRPPAQVPDDMRCTWNTLLLAAVLPLTALALLHLFEVPLGCPGRFVYLYSPVVGLRLRALPAAMLLGAALAGGIWMTGARSAVLRRIALGLAALAGIGLGVWAYCAPPYFVNQHFLNMHSPSQDGAFVSEALQVTSVRDYLRGFPERARTPPEHMRGTRVISNPPGPTLLAVGLERVLNGWPALAQPIRAMLARDLTHEAQVHSGTLGLVFFGVLTALWLLAAVFLYFAGRLLLSGPLAGAYALCCVFSPMTLVFSPGKDPAQLLTVAGPLWLWLAAYRRTSPALAAVAGMAFVLACLASLVHVWIAVIVAVATLLAARGARRALLVRMFLPAIGGAVIAGTALHLVGDLDFIAAARAVAAAQADVTRGPSAMPLAWQLLGVPLFLLFAGPAVWTVAVWQVAPRPSVPDRTADMRLGRFLALGAAAVMLGTIGFTNVETPRLWMAFVPLLLLGGLVQLAVLREPAARVRLLLAGLVFLQVSCSALTWSLMDMRETETRLVEQRYFH